MLEGFCNAGPEVLYINACQRGHHKGTVRLAFNAVFLAVRAAFLMILGSLVLSCRKGTFLLPNCTSLPFTWRFAWHYVENNILSKF